jgi:hypothetical protein
MVDASQLFNFRTCLLLGQQQHYAARSMPQLLVRQTCMQMKCMPLHVTMLCQLSK